MNTWQIHLNSLFSSGTLAVAIMGLVLGIFSLQLHFLVRRDNRYAWAAATCLATILYALGVYIQREVGAGPASLFAERLQYTGLLLLISAMFGFSLVYLGLDGVRYHRITAPLHALAAVILWSSHWFFDTKFVERHFLLLDRPYVEPQLSIAGQVLMGYLSLSALAMLVLFFRAKQRSPYIVVGTLVWLVFGLHDALATMGMPAVNFLLEYGFLCFISGVMAENFDMFFGLLHLTEEQRQALDRDRQRLDAILRSLGDGLVVTDCQGAVALINDAALKLTGIERQFALGRPISELCRVVTVAPSPPGETRNAPPDLMAPLREATRQEARLHPPQGGQIPIILSASTIEEPGVPSGGRVFSFHDISELKKAESDRIASEKRYRLIAENVTDIIWVMNLESLRFEYISPAIRVVTGFSQEEALTMSLEQTLAPESLESVMQIMAGELARDGAPGVDPQRSVIIQARQVLRGGGYTWIEARASFMRDAAGKPEAILGMTRDISERKKAEAQREQLEILMRQAQKMESIGTLAGGIAHDFNNLLQGIEGRTALMLLDTAPQHPHFEQLKEIEEYIRSASGLTRQLLGFAGGGKYEVRTADMNLLVDKSATMFGRTRKDIVIQRALQPDLWPVEVDHGQIEQVLLNLLVNAGHAMPEGGEIRLETRNVIHPAQASGHEDLAPGRYTRVSVADTGIGMDDHTLSRVFEPFFTTKTVGRGTGLGLASSYGIIRNHGGLITVASQPGLGATFTFFLPASQQKVEAPLVFEKAQNDQIPTGSETILLVDDEEMIREVGQAMLESLGYQVRIAQHGLEAIELVRQSQAPPDLVILDIIMPGVSGAEVFDMLKDMQPDLKVLIASGYSADSHARQILARGCQGYIQKPFKLRELSQKIRDILDLRT